jgi:hypothetical protein
MTYEAMVLAAEVFIPSKDKPGLACDGIVLFPAWPPLPWLRAVH